MDIEAIDKIVNRKRLLEDVDRLQEKISSENKEIIKLQVAQDTAFWEQKEKLADVKSEHERLQQNNLQLQMQYEELSSKHQEELRCRHEILNKANYTRKLCDELEKLVQQCTEQSARGKADRERLVAIYAAADKTVCGLQQRHEAMVAQAKTRINELQEKLKGKNEQQEQLREKYNESQLQLQALCSQLEAARSDRNELAAATEGAKKQLEAANTELNKRDDAITNLKREMRNMATNIHSQLTEAKNILTKKDNDLKSAADEIESLKKALSNQEEFTKMQCDRNNELLEKLALVEDQQQLAEASNNACNKKLEEMTSMCENHKNNMAKLKDENEALTKELHSKQQMLNLYVEELASYKQRLLDYDFKLDKVTLELNKTTEESENKNKLIEKMEAERDKAEEKLKSQAETIKEICCEIEIHTSTIMQANMELQSEKEERAKLMVELQNITAALEERDRELEGKTSALIEEKEAREKIEADFEKLKRDSEIEVETLRDQLREKEAQLEAGRRIPARLNSSQDSLYNYYTESSSEPVRLRPQRATSKHIAFASEMHSPCQRPPTPAPQRARDARDARDPRHTAPQSQASQFTAFEQLRAGESPTPTTTKAPKRARADAPGTAVAGEVARRNDPPAADSFTTGSKTTITKERRFFKTPRNSSTVRR